MITKEQWIEWRDHPVTLAIQEAVKQRIIEVKDELASPLSEAERDRFLKGMIWAFNEVVEIKPEISNEEFVDEVFSGDAGRESTS